MLLAFHEQLATCLPYIGLHCWCPRTIWQKGQPWPFLPVSVRKIRVLHKEEKLLVICSVLIDSSAETEAHLFMGRGEQDMLEAHRKWWLAFTVCHWPVEIC